MLHNGKMYFQYQLIKKKKTEFNTMKYQVIYLKPKKKAYSKQIATFLTIEDAGFWEQIVKDQGCKEIEIVPLFELAHT